MLGKTIDGKYQIVRLLGQGGMGAVYEATHVGTGRRVALKVIIAETISRDAILRFQREARAAGVIESQHIVQVLDTGIDRELGVPFMVMEYLLGEDLQKLYERIGALSPELALRIAAQACAGLQKAHEAHVVHRDIKPANIYLARRDDDLVVKLLDFGIAKVKEEQLTGGTDPALTRTGSMMGSPLYMSPEQAQGLKTVDHRTDVWSLGAVLYEVLAGKTPHHRAETLGQLIMAICSAPPAPIQQLAPTVPQALADIVHRALQLDPKDRFQSVAEMRDAIRQLLLQGTNLTEAMLVPDPGAQSVANLQTLVLATGGAVAGNTADPFSRTASRTPSNKAPLVIGLSLGTALGGTALWFALHSQTDAAGLGADASASVTPPPIAAALPPPPVPVETAPTAAARPSTSAAVLPAAPASQAPPTAKLPAGRTPATVKGTASAAAAATVALPSPAPAAPAAAAPAPKAPAPKSTGLTVDKNFE
jgi:eukaryotic-like serine/threonine-protein kinase